MKQTSFETYHQIKGEGLISDKEMDLYEIIHLHGPITAKEADAIYKRGNNRSRELWKVAYLLKEQGLIREVERAECSVTGRPAMKLEVTGDMPSKHKMRSRNKIKDDIVEQAEGLVEAWRQNWDASMKIHFLEEAEKFLEELKRRNATREGQVV